LVRRRITFGTLLAFDTESAPRADERRPGVFLTLCPLLISVSGSGCDSGKTRADSPAADIRNRCMVHSADAGTLMVIPRENRLVRLYIQLKEVSAGGGRVDRSQITPEFIFRAAQKIIAPYKLEYHYCDWWTAYQIGQRMGDRFSKFDRVFLAGGKWFRGPTGLARGKLACC
jgi:hypothetical protein